MFVPKVNAAQFRVIAANNKSFLFSHVKYFNWKWQKGDPATKRGAILTEWIANKDKRKNWHFNIVSDKPKARLFDKVHKPHRRHKVLNSLFIKNITDVISTGDITPEIANFGVEITGVKISPCCKILNVFWQVPSSHFNSCEDIGKILTIASPKIRAELISRNVLGRVPYIFFLRDSTNERIAAFEKAMQNLDLGPELDSPIIVDDSFTKDIFSFKTVKDEEEKNVQGTLGNIKEDFSDSNRDTKEMLAFPQKPIDMKCDIFGLDHEQMMQKVTALKKRKRPPGKTALISPDNLSSDLFDKIPGVCFQAEESRDEILKQFHISRKLLRQKKNDNESPCGGHVQHFQGDDIGDIDDAELNSYGEDFFDDE